MMFCRETIGELNQVLQIMCHIETWFTISNCTILSTQFNCQNQSLYSKFCHALWGPPSKQFAICF